METVRLLSIRLSGFRSFLDESHLAFDKKGLVCLHGVDTRTGGSNGSGKSSVLEAIYWILGINTLPSTELKNYNAKSMEGQLSLEIGPDIWDITRTSSKLSIKINNTEVDGMKNVLQDKIFEKIGDPEIFEILSYRRQSDLGKFFYTQDTKLKQFFSKCIPELDVLDNISEKASETAKKIQSDIDTQSSVLDAIKSDPILTDDLTSFTTDLEELRALLQKVEDQELILKERVPSSFLSKEESEELSILNGQVVTLKENINTLNERVVLSRQTLDGDPDIVSINNEINKKQEERSNLHYQEMSKAAKDQISLMEATLQQIGNKEREMANKLSLIATNMAALNELNPQISHLTEMTCPTCLRHWEDSNNKLDKLLAQKKTLMEHLVQLDNEVNQYPNFGDQISSIKSNITKLNEQVSASRDLDRELSIEISNIQSQIPILKNQKLKDITSELHQMESQIGRAHV